MPNLRTYMRSFAGGTISPEMFGRIDDVKYQQGAAELKNVVVQPQGAVTRRPGFEFCGEANVTGADNDTRARLIPFFHSFDQTVVLELTDRRIRFWVDGAPLLANPPAFIGGGLGITFNTGNGNVTWASHGLSVGMPIQVTTSGTNPTGPTIPVADGTTATNVYVAQVVDANTIRLKLTLTGATITSYATAGAGTLNGWPFYSHGDVVQNAGVNYHCYKSHIAASPPNATYWYPMPSDGRLEIPGNVLSDFSENLRDIHYAQSNDTMTFVHPEHFVGELRRISTTKWTFTELQSADFAGNVSSPTGVGFTSVKGESMQVLSLTAANPTVITTISDHTFSKGDSVIVQVTSGQLGDVTGLTGVGQITAIVATTPALNTITLKSTTTGDEYSSTVTSIGTVFIRPILLSAQNTQTYGVSAISSDGSESQVTYSTVVTNNLSVRGSSNTITWTAVSGASLYRVYKLSNGLYGTIGETATTSFVDDNIGADLGITPPILDASLSSPNNFPRAVAYFEGRAWFGGTDNGPQDVWATRANTDKALVYHLPTVDDDRIYFRIASREPSVIRHIVPMSQLLILTNTCEYRVTPINSDAITPSTISVRPQSYVGASNVQPIVINNTVVFGSARGGHLREMGYQIGASGYVTGDLSLRAAHLFDDFNIVEMAYSKAPYPIIWAVSSNGKLLSLTYIPEEQIGAWAVHETDGDIESVACAPEGDEDRVYVVVRRTVNGTKYRYVERMQAFHDREEGFDLKERFYVDSGLTFDGRNTGSTTVTVSNGSVWSLGEAVKMTASAALFTVGTTDIGDQIVLFGSDGTEYRITITSVQSTTVAYGTLESSAKILPVSLRETATTSWAFARDTMSGLTHLNGKSVYALAEGAVIGPFTVSSGVISIGSPKYLVHAGLSYDSQIQTLPVTLQIDGYAQGRTKNVNKAWVRVFETQRFKIGVATDRLHTVASDGSVVSKQLPSELMTPEWNESGQIVIRQSDPLPLTVLGLTLQVATGD